ncbi:MAG: SRPBCC family protein [Chloroflexi bacterium]|nr:SRPBCC family protein [Chloroflexota bacterium]
MVQAERIIKSPLEEVWQVIADPQQLPAWLPGATRVEVRAGPSGKYPIWYVERHSGAESSTHELQITLWEPPRCFAWMHIRDTFNGAPDKTLSLFRQQVLLTSVPQGTRVRLSATWDSSNLKSMVVGQLIAPKAVRSTLEEGLNAFAHLFPSEARW